MYIIDIYIFLALKNEKYAKRFIRYQIFIMANFFKEFIFENEYTYK